MNKSTFYIYLITISLFGTTLSKAQLLFQDDFQMDKNQWFWISDGNQSIPEVKNGLLKLHLSQAVETAYCNTEIYNSTEPYEPGTQVRVRLKTSEMHTGSRGWGFWDRDLNLTELIYDFDVAWVIQQGSLINDPAYKWFLFGVAKDTIINSQTFVLDSLVNETEWNTYKIVWDYDRVGFYIDDIFVYETFECVPDQKMRMDIWIDNRIMNIANPIEYWNNAVESSEMLIDFVEISNIKGPAIKRNSDGNIILWETPNTFPNGNKDSLWKEYDFEVSSAGETLIFLTGQAESYDNMKDDKLNIQINEEYLGLDSNNSLSGSELNGKGKSLIIKKNLEPGKHKIKFYSVNTPFLKDVIILNAENGITLFAEDYNEEIKNERYLKTINFNSNGSDNLTVIVSGTAKAGGGLRFEIDENDYGWSETSAIIGDSLKGLPNTVVINKPINKESHTINIYGKMNSELYSVAVYGSKIITDLSLTSLPEISLTLKTNPNPFNISTNIFYNTSSTSLNKLRIVNILGEEIATLVNEVQTQGNHNVIWNAKNETSGIYFCILESDNEFKVEKVILMK